MTDQLDIFATQTARLSKDDTTSVLAAESASKHAKGDIIKVLRYLDTFGPATPDEIADGLRMDWRSIRPRCSQARKKWGWVIRTDVLRAPHGGCVQHELAITEAGRKVLGEVGL